MNKVKIITDINIVDLAKLEQELLKKTLAL